MTLTTPDQIEKLRKSLYSQQMSILIGSGFSKNVSTIFPDWDELLYDIGLEIYSTELATSYEKYLAQEEPQIKLEKEIHYKKLVREFFKRDNYLDVVTKFLNLRGIPEAIITYIEDRVPTIELVEDEIVLSTKKESLRLPSSKLSLHRSIVSLPWQNIYTTNYDHLLDVCVNQHINDAQADEITQLEIKSREIEERIWELEDEQKRLKATDDHYKQAETATNDQNKKSDPGNIGEETFQVNEKMSIELKSKLDSLRNNLDNVKTSLAEKDALVRSMYKIVLKAADFGDQSHRNLVKLHGNLRDKTQRKSMQIGFDGDRKTQYIISRDHYQTYDEKHDTFRRVMDVAILRGSFCLIGFSGSDPNFLQWTDWVFKAFSNNQEGKNFIYLIDLSTNEPDESLSLHYAQNRIIRIPIRSAEAIGYLERKTQSIINSEDYGEVLAVFLKYLSVDSKTDAPVSKADLDAITKRRDAWKTNRFYDVRKPLDPKVVSTVVDKLDSLKSVPMLPNLDDYETDTQHTLISHADLILNQQNKGVPSEREKMLKLMLYAIKDYHLPISEVLDDLVILECLENPTTKELAVLLVEQNQVLTSRSISGAPKKITNKYMQGLQLAYKYEFDKLKKFLKNWTPTPTEILYKAGLCLLVDQKETDLLLTKGISLKHELSAEYALYLHQMTHFIGWGDLMASYNTLNKVIVNYEKAGIQGIYDRLSPLQEKIERRSLPIERERIISRHGDDWSLQKTESTAVQFLMMLIDSGFQLGVHYRVLFDKKKWLPVLKAGFNLYPEPFLFYSLQYGDESFLKEVGKLYASSSRIASDLPVICVNLIKNLSQLPHYLREHAYSFLSEALIAVEPSLWQQGLFTIWKILLKEEKAFSDRRSATCILFSRTLTYMDDLDIILSIISDLLDEEVFTERTQAISFMYYLNQNRFYKKSDNNMAVPEKLSSKFDQLIDDLSRNIENNMFVLANLSKLLSQKQRENLIAKLVKVDFNTIKNVRIWRLIIFYSDQNVIVFKKIKKALLNHSMLWYTGIEENTIHGMSDHLSLMNLTKTKFVQKGLTWTKSEIIELFQKMRFPLSEIVRMKPANDFIQTFTPILLEMVTFLELYQPLLKDIPNFENELETARNLYRVNRKYDNIHEGLLSKDGNIIDRVLSELNNAFIENRFPEEALNMLIYRIMLQVEPEIGRAHV